MDHSATQPQLIDTPSSPLSQLRLDEYSETTPTTVHRDRERERERGPAPAATAASELRPSSAVPFHQSNVVLNYQQQSNISSNMCQMGNINRKRSAKFLKSVGQCNSSTWVQAFFVIALIDNFLMHFFTLELSLRTLNRENIE